MFPISDRIKTFGDSMRPLLLDGDVVFFKKKLYPKIKVDDIVVVKKNKTFLTHRVIYKRENYLVTKGDYDNLSDGKIYSKNVIGIVYKIKRSGQTFGIDNLYLFQSTLYFQEIVKVKKAFEKAKIDFLFLKGLLLHLYFEKYYPRRLYRDCDILVAKNQFKKAKRVLFKMGYKEYGQIISATLQQLKSREPEVNLCKEVNGVIVTFDLHQEIVFMAQMTGLNSLYPHTLINQFSKDLLREKRRVAILNESFSILSIDNLLIYTALHLYHHNFVGPFRYELMRIFLKNKELDYEKVVGKVKNYRLQSFIYSCFLFLQKYYNVDIPYVFMDQIKPPKNKELSINTAPEGAHVVVGPELSLGVSILFSVSFP